MKFKKLIALLMAMCCVVPFTACSPDDNGGGNVDPNLTTVISFMNFNGGIGSVWLEKAAERFQTLRANHSYATGKTGVYIDIAKSMSVGTSNMKDSGYHIYTAEQYSTAVPALLAAQNLLLDITEWVQDDTREGGSIEDNLFDSVKGSLTLEEDGETHYYGLPHYESYGGLQYNHGIFEEVNDGNGLFIADAEEYDIVEYSSPYGTVNLVGSPEAVKSAGPDGEKGTTDDGLPSSLQELIIFMSYFKENTKYAPVTISGACLNYSNYFSSGLWAALAGAEQMRNYYNCSGWVEIVKREGGGSILYTNENLFPGIDYIKKPQTEWVNLNETNGYLGQQMVAKFYTIALYEIMEKEGFYAGDTYISTRSHYDGQAGIFIGSAGGYSDAAMLIEASYWYGEAEEGGTFTLYETLTGYDSADLDLRMYPLPSKIYNDSVDREGNVIEGRATSFIDISHCYLFVNKNIENQAEVLAAVEDFVKFLYTEDELEYFTVETGEPRAIKYDLTDAQLAEAGSYVANLWSLRDNAAGSNIIYCSGTTQAFRSARESLKLYLSGEGFKSDTNHFLASIRSGINNGKGTEDVFEGAAWTQAQWESIAG